MNPIERVVRAVDRFQQAHKIPAMVFAVIKKYGDDAAGNLASVLAFSGLITVFPLLLMLVTVLGLVLSNDPHLRNEILNSTFDRFPGVGSELRNNVSALHRSSMIGLIVSIVLLLWGSLGLAQNGIYAMSQIWNLPGVHRSDWFKRTGRSLEFIAILGLGLLLSTFLTALATNTSARPFVADAGAIVASFIVACVQFILGYRVLTAPQIKWGSLLPGALVAAVGWTILQAFGTFLVGHTLKDSAVYGVFAFVLGLIFWISLVVRLVLYTSELNVVLHRRLWPRSIVQPPLTQADRVVLAAQAEQNRRRPEQHVYVTFDDLAEVGETKVASDAAATDAAATDAAAADRVGVDDKAAEDTAAADRPVNGESSAVSPTAQVPDRPP